MASVFSETGLLSQSKEKCPGVAKSSGMPIGLQVIGDHLKEQTILDIAYQYEQSTEWHLRNPEFLIHE